MIRRVNRIILVRMNDSRFAQEPNGSCDQYGQHPDTLLFMNVSSPLSQAQPATLIQRAATLK